MSRYRREHEKIVGQAQARALAAEAEAERLKLALEHSKRQLQDKDMILSASSHAMEKLVGLLRIMRRGWEPIKDDDLEAVKEIDRILADHKSDVEYMKEIQERSRNINRLQAEIQQLKADK